MPLVRERDVLVLSSDLAVCAEIDAAIARHPGTRAIFAGSGNPPLPRVGCGGCIVVIDDEQRTDAVELLQQLTTDGVGPVVYLTAKHSTALEEAVRRAGASFYAVKAARDGDLVRVLEVMIARGH